MSDDLFEGEKRKREGMARVNDADWQARAIAAARKCLPWDTDFIGSSIRVYIVRDVGEPRHPNAWGALASNLRRLKVVRGTGVYRKSRSAKNHAHKYEVLRRWM